MTTETYRYAYLIGNTILLFPIWLMLFLHRKDLRKQLCIIGSVMGILRLLARVWIKSYWHPQTFAGTPIGLEDFLFAFFMAGIATTIYQSLWGRHAVKADHERSWPLILVATGLLTVALAYALIYLNIISSFQSSFIIFLLPIAVMLLFRKDLIKQSLWSGVIMMFIVFACYVAFLTLFPDIIQRWWTLKNLSGIFIYGIPLEELIFAGIWGLFGGIVYQFATGQTFKR